MFIKRTTRRVGATTYVNHLLVESVATPQGSRHRTICSLGSLAPAPAEQWRSLAHKLAAALGGQRTLVPEPAVEALAARVRPARRRPHPPAGDDVLAIHTDQVRVEDVREAGPVHVGHQMWQALTLDPILAAVGLSARARRLTEIMTLNRLVGPASEHAMPDWIRRTALGDILGTDFTPLADDALYLYDLTSTYFEGQCPFNPQAQRGYSRDHRPDCKQVVVGLVLDHEGFPKAHEVFDGNRQDRTTLDAMLHVLEQRTGRRGGATVVIDRGMAFPENLAQIQARAHHYIVAGRPAARYEHQEAFEDDTGWTEIFRTPSPRNPAQKKTRVFIKRAVSGAEVHILCRSDGRLEKDRAIRDTHEGRFLRDLTKLQLRVTRGRLRAPAKIHEALGRLKERYPRVARYYTLAYEATTRAVTWTANVELKARAEHLDGAYLLRTDRQDLSEEEIWRLYILLTRVEAAFRAMKTPLMERPIFPHLEHRVQTHIFLFVLAYHLLVAIEKRFLDQGVHTSWATLREQLSTHQVVTVVLPSTDGQSLRIRKTSTPDAIHHEIYDTLRIPWEVIKPVKSWAPS